MLFRRDQVEWYQTFVFFKKRSIDGQYVQGDVWARKINGQWQYRALTEEEQFDVMYKRVW